MHTSAHLHQHTTRRVARGARSLLVALLAAAAALAGLVAVPSTAHAAGSTSVGSAFDTQVLALTNVQREKYGLKPLRAMSCVDGYANRWTRRLANEDKMYHQALRPIMRNCNLRTAGENLAWRGSSLSAAQVVSMWMNSPGHRRNILTARYKYLGVAAWRSSDTGRVYAGQVFGG